MSNRTPSSFDLPRLRDGLKPFRLHFFPTLRSTNDHAAVLRRRGDLFAPAVVLAARQTAGRGRGANTWFSAPGSITVTFVIPGDQALAPHQVPLAAGLAARNAAAELAANDDIQLKWPNDLVVVADRSGSGLPLRGTRPPLRKLAGLLCERIDHVDLVGIGLNVNLPAAPPPPPLRDRVVFLQQLRRDKPVADPFDLTDALLTLARHVHAALVRAPDAPFTATLREYDRHHALIGRTVTVRGGNEPAVTGVCQGLDDTGRLLLRTGKTVHRVIAGHVETV